MSRPSSFSCHAAARGRLLALLLIACCGVGCGRPAPPRDLILITVDTLRADRLGSYGYAAARTPAIDALAARGVRFERAFTPFPRTTPGLASLMTGLWPQHHGSREVGRAMTTTAPTLAERLRAHGFRTFGITANGAGGRGQGFGRGFETLLEPANRQRRAPAVTEQALGLLDGVTAEQRLFLWVHYVDPHFPYSAPGPRDHSAATCTELMKLSSRGRLQAGLVFYNRGGLAARALPSCSPLYDAEINYTDSAIGALLDALDVGGRLADALVVFTADHGENLGEQGLYYQHGSSLHDASLRVPLIVAGPGIAPAVDSGLIGLEDLMPTLLRRLDVGARDAGFDGRDQSPRLGRGAFASRDPAPEVLGSESGSALVAAAFHLISSGRAGGLHCTNGERYSLCQEPDGPARLYDHQDDPGLEHDLAAELPREVRRLERLRQRWPPEEPRQRAVRDSRFKLVEVPRRRGGYARVLYDLESDPAESVDASDQYPDVIARLGPALDRWVAMLPKVEVEAPLDDETIDQLRALGYID